MNQVTYGGTHKPWRVSVLSESCQRDQSMAHFCILESFVSRREGVDFN